MQLYRVLVIHAPDSSQTRHGLMIYFQPLYLVTGKSLHRRHFCDCPAGFPPKWREKRAYRAAFQLVEAGSVGLFVDRRGGFPQKNARKNPIKPKTVLAAAAIQSAIKRGFDIGAALGELRLRLVG